MDYNARYYDPYLNRFVSADTIVPEPGNPQDMNGYAYVRNKPVKHVDPTGHAVGDYPPGCANSPQCMKWWQENHRAEYSQAVRRRQSYLWQKGEADSMAGVKSNPSPAAAPAWDNLGPRVAPGSREDLYIQAYNIGLAPWQDHPTGSIDDRFDPFYVTADDPVFAGHSSGEWYEPAGEALYSDYGGLPNLANLVTKRCYYNRCNNPLNGKDDPFGSHTPGFWDVSLVMNTGMNPAMGMFLTNVPEKPGATYGGEYAWNFEPLWLLELMKQHPQALLDAQWQYLDIYRTEPGPLEGANVDLDPTYE
jgi:hypothetical protein